MRRVGPALVFGALVLGLVLHAVAYRRVGEGIGPDADIDITVVVDDRASREGFRASHGFACVVRGFEETLLFDTGEDGDTLMSNLDKRRINPRDIDGVVLSHAHGDHTGGLRAFLAVNPKVTVYLLPSFPERLRRAVRKAGARAVEVNAERELCPYVYTTGPLGTRTPEQSLVLRTRRGLVVITGCAHPGIVDILDRAARRFPGDGLLLAMGGFHLMKSRRPRAVVSNIKKRGARYVGPCHCTGQRAKSAFVRAYQDHFIELGAGVRIAIPRRPKSDCGREVCVEGTEHH